MACMHDPRSGQEGHIDANGVVERRPFKTGRGTIWSGGYGGGAADKQYSVVVARDQAAFGGEIQYVCGVGELMRGNVVAERGRKGLRVAELDISACCIAEGVFTLCLFPVILVVVQQSVREVGSCSLDIKVRYCRMQWRRRRREVRREVGRDQCRASRGRASGPIAEAATCGAEKAQKRRTRRTHCVRRCDSSDAMGHCRPRSRFDFVCAGWVVGHRRGRQ